MFPKYIENVIDEEGDKGGVEDHAEYGNSHLHFSFESCMLIARVTVTALSWLMFVVCKATLRDHSKCGNTRLHFYHRMS